MSNTYRSSSRDHRSKVSIAVTAIRRTARAEALPMGCEMSPTCREPAAQIRIHGMSAEDLPVVCQKHLSMVR